MTLEIVGERERETKEKKGRKGGSERERERELKRKCVYVRESAEITRDRRRN